MAGMEIQYWRDHEFPPGENLFVKENHRLNLDVISRASQELATK
ncbi:MAG: hypothetical protein AB1656_04970 [Candidatus Omnitrophota bacterium]